MTYPDSLLSTFDMDALVGASKTFALRLRRKGTKLNWDVSASTLIQMEVVKIGEEDSLQIPFNPATPGADFINGRLVGTLGPVDVCARVGTYYLAITAVFNGVTQAVARGNIEVLPRPIKGPVPIPGGAYYNTSNFELGFNPSETETIIQGSPVCKTPDGIVLATAAAGGVLEVDGFVLVDIPPKQSGLFMLAGSFMLDDWTDIAGTADLAVATPYYLDVAAGHITTVMPSAPAAGLVQLVGTSEDGRILDLALGQYAFDT